MLFNYTLTVFYLRRFFYAVRSVFQEGLRGVRRRQSMQRRRDRIVLGDITESARELQCEETDHNPVLWYSGETMARLPVFEVMAKLARPWNTRIFHLRKYERKSFVSDLGSSTFIAHLLRTQSKGSPSCRWKMRRKHAAATRIKWSWPLLSVGSHWVWIIS